MLGAGATSGDVAVPERRRRDAPLHAMHRPDRTVPIAEPLVGSEVEPAVEPAPRRHRTEVAGGMLTTLLALVVSAIVLSTANAEVPSEPASAGPDLHTETSVPSIRVASTAGGPVEVVELPADLSLAAVHNGSGVPETGGYSDLLREHFGAHAVEAIVIVQCESGFRPDAVGTNRNGTQDHGLFQINDVHRDAFAGVTGHPWEDRYDPEVNTVFASWLFDRAGWNPWSCSRDLAELD